MRSRQSEKSGYQKLLELILLDQTVRVVTAGSAILQKCHFYEILSEIKRLGDHLAEERLLFLTTANLIMIQMLELREQTQNMKAR